MKTNYKNIALVIFPTPFCDFDLIAIGDIKLLKQLAHKNKYFPLIKKSKFGGTPILILDTYDTLSDTMKALKAYKKLYDSESKTTLKK
jgi:hypothetical protein